MEGGLELEVEVDYLAVDAVISPPFLCITSYSRLRAGMSGGVHIRHAALFAKFLSSLTSVSLSFLLS